ncbi:MAG: CDP-alcohol phosphatidyltransferase family protein, partial [Eggerthellaceae bacterium]
MKQGDTPQNDSSSEELVIDKIFTIPNVISMVRLCLVPVFLVLLMNGNDIAAALLFALAAGTDFLDGQIARRTNTVSK